MYSNISHFKQLNSLRFIAAFLVLIHHAEKVRTKYILPSFEEYSIANLGGFAVTFFFVLSGFLITYLLLKERQQTNRISIKKFYMRRIIRIWPLYFLLVALGLFIIPSAIHLIGYPYDMPYSTSEVWYYYVFFTPFMVNIFYGSSLLEPLWSIGVEEIFYLILAPLLIFIKKHILALLLSILAICLVFKTALWATDSTQTIVGKVASMLEFEAMAIGGLTAWWLFGLKREIGTLRIFNPLIQIIALVFLALRMFGFGYLSQNFVVFDYLFFTPILSQTLLILLFAYTIINLSLNSRCIIKRESKTVEWLGNLSYGVYMYHMITIFFVILVAGRWLSELSTLWSSLLFYSAVVPLTILVCYASKRFFEDKFLKLRGRYATYK